MDTDKDDIYSLIILLAQHSYKSINLIAIVCDDGFLPYPENISLTSFFLDFLKINIPIYHGINRNPYLKTHRNFPPSFIDTYLQMLKKDFGYSYKKSFSSPIDILIERLQFYPSNSLNILLTGNATSLSHILDEYDWMLNKTNRVVMMGGNIHCKGNILPCPEIKLEIAPDAEYNFWLDPDAIQNTLRILKNKIEIIPLDCTNYAPLTEKTIADIQQIAKDIPKNIFYNTFIKLLNTTIHTENGTLYLWDLVATIIFLNYNIDQNLVNQELSISMTGKMLPKSNEKCQYYNSINFQQLKENIVHSLFYPK